MSDPELRKALARLDELLVANPQSADEIEEQIALIEKLERWLEEP